MPSKRMSAQTFQQWRKARAEKPKPKRRKTEYPAMRPMMLNKNAILIGFDAGADGCGLATYDVAKAKVLECVKIHYNDVSEWLDKQLEQHGGKLHCRAELATSQSTYGDSSAKGNKEKFARTRSGGGNAQVAKLFIDLLVRKGITFEVVKAQFRFNVTNRKLPKAYQTPGKPPRYYSEWSGAQLREHFRRTKTPLPTKLTAAQISAFFKLEKHHHNNKETRDALGLLLPELYFFA